MNIQTKFFGEIEVNAESIIEFPNGLPGFENEQQFVLLEIDEEGIYHSLQSIHSEKVALIVSNPYLFFNAYEFTLDQSTQDILQITDENDVVVLSVLTLRDPFSESTANLQAPIIWNNKMNKAKQLILVDTEYETKHPITASQKDGESDVNP